MQKQPSEGLFKMVFWEISLNSQENICNGISFWCFLVNFAKFARTPLLQNSSGRLLLIIAVSIVAKGVLANQTVNYETRTKAYVIIWASSLKLLKREVQVKEQVSEAGFRRFQIRCSSKSCKLHRKTSALESIFNKGVGQRVCNSVKKKLQHSYLPGETCKISKNTFFTKEFRFWRLTSVSTGVRGKNRRDCHQ